MKSRFPLYVLAGLAVVGAIVFFSFQSTKGAHLELKGEILKVRALALSDKATLLALDFRVTNVADVPFMVRTTEVTLDQADGQPAETFMVSRYDMERVFQSAKLIGPKYNEVLTLRDRIKAHETVDRMVAVRVELAEADVEARKGLKLRIEDTDGAVCELVEKRLAGSTSGKK